MKPEEILAVRVSKLVSTLELRYTSLGLHHGNFHAVGYHEEEIKAAVAKLVALDWPLSIGEDSWILFDKTKIPWDSLK